MNQRQVDSVPRYVISIAAEILNMQAYTLRYYEKIGIVEPYRSRGNIRLYSDRDIELIRRIKSLVEDMGINLAGVEVILRLTQRINQLQDDLEEKNRRLKKIRGE